MKRKVTLFILIDAALRYSGHLARVTEAPLLQVSSRYGPVPTGLVALVSALLGSTMMAVAWPIRNRKSGLSSLLMMTTV